jgi:hypothetical protein
MPSPDFKNFAADQVVLTFAGLRIQGYADGSFVSVEPMSPGFSSKAGADGLVSRSRSNDPRVKITITLEQTSSSNDVLSAIHEADLAMPNGAGVAALSLEDLLGRFRLVSASAWVEKAPTAEFGRETGQRAWELVAIVPPGARINGGN